jgi:RNA polymerase sigma-70 factor (ECF subfamily)
MAGFATTRWTLVQRAGDTTHPDAADALEYLCRVYWPAVYVFFRRKGAGAPEAADLTQEFFARVLEKRYLEQARRERGTFRTFLLTCAKNFLANEWDRHKALKRGGGQRVISLDDHSVEDRYQREPHHDLTPEHLFEQQWAWSVVQQALGRLEEDIRGAGREQMYAECRDLLLGGTGDVSYRDIAARLNITEGALKVQVHRLRRRLRELVLDEIQQAGGPDADPEGELRHLLTLLARPRE